MISLRAMERQPQYLGCPLAALVSTVDCPSFEKAAGSESCAVCGARIQNSRDELPDDDWSNLP